MYKKYLVAYFSASGTTKQRAKEVAGTIGADLYEICPKELYTAADLDWNNSRSRSSIEMKDLQFRPALEEQDINIADYEEIVIGFPVWWYVAPTIINSFLESHDFAGKSVTLFATSGGSGIENCEKNLKKQYPNINWKPGKLLNSTRAVDAFITQLQ